MFFIIILLPRVHWSQIICSAATQYKGQMRWFGTGKL